MALIETDLPDPVVPATNKCGILLRSVIKGFPEISFPNASIRPFVLSNISVDKISFRKTVSIFLLGSSIPIAFFP